MSVLDVRREALREFCVRLPIRRLAPFGSVLRGSDRPDSDLDLLVEFVPGAPVGYLEMAEIQFGLSELLGREVDLRTPQELSRYFRDEVVRGAETIYAS